MKLKSAKPDIKVITAGFFHWMNTAFELASLSGKGGIREWQKAMKEALIVGYVKCGAKPNSGQEAFVRFVSERDRALGLPVEFKKIKNGFIYRFYRCPFIQLKERYKDCKELSTNGYLKAKRDFFIPEYRCRTTKTIWEGAPYCEHIFERG